jgi:hypothetical protein
MVQMMQAERLQLLALFSAPAPAGLALKAKSGLWHRARVDRTIRPVVRLPRCETASKPLNGVR